MTHLAPARSAPVALPWSVAELAAADDAGIVALLAGAEVRRAALAAAVEAAPTTGLSATVLLEVVLSDGSVDATTITVHPDGARAGTEGEADVSLRIPLVPLVRLLVGQADGALLYLSGVLQVTGREDLLLALGSALVRDGRPLVDPAALDPVAVSRAIADVRTEHLAGVMAGGFRGLVLAEVFGRLPEFVIAEKAARVRVAIGFEIGGRDDGVPDRYVVRIRDGACTVTADATPDEEVDATLVLAGHQFLRLVLGHLNPVRGVLSGEVAVRGAVVKALGFNAVMRIPGS